MVVRGCEGFGGGDVGDSSGVVAVDDDGVGGCRLWGQRGGDDGDDDGCGGVRMMYGEVVWRGRRWCVGCWPELGWPEILPEKMAAPEVVREEERVKCVRCPTIPTHTANSLVVIALRSAWSSVMYLSFVVEGEFLLLMCP
ncbi:hypothetical protein Tco_0640325 [Tanacetum coccineum]